MDPNVLVWAVLMRMHSETAPCMLCSTGGAFARCCEKEFISQQVEKCIQVFDAGFAGRILS